MPVQNGIKLTLLFIQKSSLTQFALTVNLLSAVLALSLGSERLIETALLWIRGMMAMTAEISSHSGILCD